MTPGFFLRDGVAVRRHFQSFALVLSCVRASVSAAKADDAPVASGVSADGKVRADMLSLKRTEGDVPQLGRPSVCPSTSNTRLGRKSPVAQGRGKMEMTYVGIDLSKDRLDVHILPEGETFIVAPDGKGLAEFVERMGTLGAERIPVEATGGSETVVAAAPAEASPPVVVVNPAQMRPFAKVLGRRAGERQFKEIHHWRSNEPEAFAGPL